MCIGIDLCSKKNCLEQEKCLFPKEKAKKKVKISGCRVHKKFCSSERACEILGQCVLDHELVKSSRSLYFRMKKAKTLPEILDVFNRAKPRVTLKGKSKNKKSRKKIR